MSELDEARREQPAEDVDERRPPRRTNLRPVQLGLLVLAAVALLVLQVRSWSGGPRSMESPQVDSTPSRVNERNRRAEEDVFGEQATIPNQVEAYEPRRIYNWAAMAAVEPLRELPPSPVAEQRWRDEVTQRVPAGEDASERLSKLWAAQRRAPRDEVPAEPAAPVSPREALAQRWDETTGALEREPFAARWEAPASPFVLQAGTRVPAILLTQMNTDLPSQLAARTTVPVYDSATGTIEILPEGTRLVGSTDHRVVLGQRAALVTWERAYLPNGSSLTLADALGSGPLGEGGLRGRVHNRYGSLYMNTLLVALAGAAFQVSQDRDGVRLGNDPTQTAGAAVAQEFFRTSDELLREQLKFLKPTLVKDVGGRFAVTVTRDYVFERPWR